MVSATQYWDRLHDVPNTLFNLGRTLSFADLNPFATAYAQALEDPRLGSALRTAIEDAQQIVQQAGQTVVIQKGIGPNPFETTGFNPDTAPPATVTANEGQLTMLTIHLPFEAGVGGQKLTLTLSGPNASGVVLRTNGLELSPNGQQLHADHFRRPATPSGEVCSRSTTLGRRVR